MPCVVVNSEVLIRVGVGWNSSELGRGIWEHILPLLLSLFQLRCCLCCYIFIVVRCPTFTLFEQLVVGCKQPEEDAFF